MAAAGLILVAVCLATSVALGQVTEQFAFDDVSKRGERAARDRIAPLLTVEFLGLDAPAVASMQQIVDQIIADEGAAGVAISTFAGETRWTHGSRSGPVPVHARGDIAADGSATTFALLERYAPQSDIEVHSIIGLEVHTEVQATDGTRVVVTVAYPIQAFAAESHHRVVRLLPLVGGGVLVVAASLLTIGFVWPRHIRRQRDERTRLLERLITSSDHERRRIAGEVHDGVVQELVGVSFALGAMVHHVPSPHDQQLHGLAVSVRNSVTALRSLLSSIYPVEVPAQGWQHGLDRPIAALRAIGIVVTTDVPDRRCSALGELLLLRVSLEALRNVAAHSQAEHLRVELKWHDELVRLRIADDGIGFDEATAQAQRAAGHFGLQLIADLACEIGAFLTVDSTPGSGTVVTLEMTETS